MTFQDVLKTVRGVSTSIKLGMDGNYLGLDGELAVICSKVEELRMEIATIAAPMRDAADRPDKNVDEDGLYYRDALKDAAIKLEKLIGA